MHNEALTLINANNQSCKNLYDMADSGKKKRRKKRVRERERETKGDYRGESMCERANGNVRSELNHETGRKIEFP